MNSTTTLISYALAMTLAACGATDDTTPDVRESEDAGAPSSSAPERDGGESPAVPNEDEAPDATDAPDAPDADVTPPEVPDPTEVNRDPCERDEFDVDGGLIARHAFTYDEAGRVLRDSADRGGDGVEDDYSAWSYDADGHLTRLESLTIDGYFYFCDMTYTAEGYLDVEHCVGGSPPELEVRIEHEWADDGLSDVAVTIGDGGSIVARDESTYLQPGGPHVLSRVSYDGDGARLRSTLTQKFDAEGRILESLEVEEGALPLEILTSYTYNAEGLPVEIRRTETQDETARVVVTPMTFDAGGHNRSRTVVEVTEDGERLISHYEFDFDDQGRHSGGRLDLDGDGAVDVTFTNRFECAQP